jgi:hypothetical protein
MTILYWLFVSNFWLLETVGVSLAVLSVVSGNTINRIRCAIHGFLN